MRHLFTAAAAAALALVPVGCGNKGTEGGTPGTDDSFHVSAPARTGSDMAAPAVKQDTATTVELTVKAKPQFSGKKVTLKAEAPAGIRSEFKPESVDLGPGEEKKIQLVVHASKDAAAGETTIKVTGTPEKGGVSTADVKVKVEANNPAGNAKDTFSISFPAHVGTLKTVKREGSETVEVTLKGDSGFTGKKVSLKADHDPKIKVEFKPASVDLGAGEEKKVQMVISPAKDAPTGEQKIRLTGTPEAGTAVSREEKVKVE